MVLIACPVKVVLQQRALAPGQFGHEDGAG